MKETIMCKKEEQERLKKEILKRLRDTTLALEQWRKDSLASQLRY